MQKNKSINKEGIGLGLYITRNLAVSLGGTIEVFSEEGLYTKFIVTLPVSRDLNTAFQKGLVKFNSSFAKERKDYINKLLQSDNEKVMEEIELRVMKA